MLILMKNKIDNGIKMLSSVIIEECGFFLFSSDKIITDASEMFKDEDR